ncbi:MAG: carbon storage regulator CsrA [Gammaproteobacteria bacterium]|nr:carbon storage regulator CsrA [Caldilineaceae bacterium]MCB1925836.1 carbon storage regulator CsrA [Gammaproteobacteria bacterium]
MLKLTRRPGEQLIIGDNIVIRILDVSGNQVRIGISAPKEISVLRDELLERMLDDALVASGRG